jgi:hypothetical protein
VSTVGEAPVQHDLHVARAIELLDVARQTLHDQSPHVDPAGEGKSPIAL